MFALHYRYFVLANGGGYTFIAHQTGHRATPLIGYMASKNIYNRLAIEQLRLLQL